MWQVLLRLLSLQSQSGFYWDTGPRYGHLTCDSDKPVPTVSVPGPARAPADSLRSLCLTHGADRRYLTMRHCPKSLNRLSNLTSAQKKAKKHMKEAREEAEIAVLQRFWVKSAIGRIIRRDCS